MIAKGLAIAAGQIQEHLLRHLLEDRVCVPRGDLKAIVENRLFRLQSAKILTDSEVDRFRTLFTDVFEVLETEGNRPPLGCNIDIYRFCIEDLYNSLLSHDASPVAIAIASIALRKLGSYEACLVDGCFAEGVSDFNHTVHESACRDLPEVGCSNDMSSTATWLGLNAALAGACIAQEGDHVSAVIGAITAAALVSYLQAKPSHGEWVVRDLDSVLRTYGQEYFEDACTLFDADELESALQFRASTYFGVVPASVHECVGVVGVD